MELTAGVQMKHEYINENLDSLEEKRLYAFRWNAFIHATVHRMVRIVTVAN